MNSKNINLEIETNRLGEESNSANERSNSAQSRDITPEITAVVIGELKLKILDIEKRFPNAGPSQILHRCCKKLEYEAQFLDRGNSSAHYVCQLRIKSTEFYPYHENSFEGKGVSKTDAKSNAIDNLLNLVKS